VLLGMYSIVGTRVKECANVPCPGPGFEVVGKGEVVR
jgi:hypothetical protein